jgi:hypothetical protein
LKRIRFTDYSTANDVARRALSARQNNYSTVTQQKLDLKVSSTDARLSDPRTPVTHTQAASTITGLATVATSGSYPDLSNKPADLTSRVAAVEAGQSATVVGFDTQANLYANLAYADKSVAYVTNDSTANNGMYRKVGASGSGSWQQGIDPPPKLFTPKQNRGLKAPLKHPKI